MTSEYIRGLLRAAEIADLYADENIRMADDTVACDPILNRKKRAQIKNITMLEAANKVSEILEIQGADHAAKHHAGLDIAKLIREEAKG
jgi:hypothetical protein